MEFDIRSKGADGVKRIHHITANPIQDEEGRLRYIVLIGVDDTERRMGEIRLFDSARLANLGEMATGMAHEINQPLTVIRMAAEGLLDELDTPEATADPVSIADLLKAKLERIVNQAERASTLVGQLLLRRPQALQRVPAVRCRGHYARGRDLLQEQLRAARIKLAGRFAAARSDGPRRGNAGCSWSS